jgi:tellurite resistance protein
MGLFDSFGGTQIQLTPKVALVAAMIYTSSADGSLDDNEAGDILRVVPDRNTLEQALQFCKRNPFQQFLDQATRLLAPQQKLCVIINCADLAMSDGHLAPEEQQRLIQMAQYFQIPESHLSPYIQTLMLKNNLSIFG